MIWIFERWTESEENICTSCFKDGQKNVIIVLQDDGFLPAGTISPYRFYVQEDMCQQKAENPLFADLLEVPDLWEIRMRFDKAEIWDEGIKKAEVDYADPVENHNTKSVRWMAQDGFVYRKDCYDKYGELYYTDMLDIDGHVDVRTYYAEKKPVLMHQPGFDTYTLLRNGKIYGMCDSRQTFLKQFLLRYFPEDKCIISNDIKILEMLSEAGRPPCGLDGDVFILTNSDRIEHVEKLICALPMLHFHIGAKTLMSDQLLHLEQYSNVTLYQGISEQKRVELLIKSTYYLDINHYREICNAVYEACRYSLLIIGFESTLHNSSYVLPECIFKTEDAEGMIRFLETMQRDSNALKSMVTQQHKLL